MSDYNKTEFDFNIREMARKYGLSNVTLTRRLRKGMSLEDAISAGTIKKYEYEGKLWELSDLARHVGIKAPTLSDRVHLQGMNIEEALKTPVKPKAVVATFSRSPAYQIWVGMRGRCYNPKNQSFKDYGGRGIEVCDRWLESAENFIQDMGQPGEEQSLGRIDNDGDYCPENCRWESRLEQQNNRRNNRSVTAFGKTQTVAQWSRESGISSGVIRKRLDTYGYTPEEAVTIPSRGTGQGGIRRMP